MTNPTSKHRLEKHIPKLKACFENPRYGLGRMHYSSLKPCDVRSAFGEMSDEFKAEFELEIPRGAYDTTTFGTTIKCKLEGCYWVVSRKNSM